MRYLVYLITLLFSTAVAQSPTILQGNYVSNVFGQANFIKNPNAQTNVANVTVSSATATRSTTTPLVATSEWNVTVTSANGTAAWATRSFDAGMKNQNCEARFSYRGFQATSKAQIKQGANVVAELTLTPSATDPRIASINFPCGDLSAATTFVITDSATLSGTNEIGGIYVGLATNQANVAQAELVGTATFQGGTSCGWSISGTQSPWTSFAASGGSCDWTSTGVVQPQSKLLKFDHVLKPGKYRAILNGTVARTAGNNDSKFVLTDGTNFSGTVGPYYNSTAGLQTPFTAILNFEVTSTQSKLIEFKVSQGPTITSSVIAYNNEYYLQYTIYRFPSSSELVVTPETQNTWGGVVYTSGNQALWIGNSVPTGFAPYNNAQWNQPTKLKGKAQVTTTNSGNDLGFSIPNLPVGNYKFDISGLLNSGNNSDTGVVAATVCNFKLIETTTSTDVARQSHTDQSYSSSISDETRDYINSFTGVFNNTSVATRNFRIEAEKIFDQNALSGQCQAYASEGVSNQKTDIAIIMTPIDNASNSALYVQGPVKAAETGTAIPAGFQGEIIRSVRTTDLTLVNGINNMSSVTLTPGVWQCMASAAIEPVAGSYTTARLSIHSSPLAEGDIKQTINSPVSGNFITSAQVTTTLVVNSVTLPVYANVYAQGPTGGVLIRGMANESLIECWRIN